MPSSWMLLLVAVVRTCDSEEGRASIFKGIRINVSSN
jgi:hypothetical protein